MIEGIKALLGSEKALVGGSLVIAATVLVALGHMTVGDWQTYTRDVFYGYIGGKTLQGVASVWAATKNPDAATTTVKTSGEVATVEKTDKPVEEKKS
jgi:hypothetical protein